MLSLGNRKRLEFGMALATKPKFLLLDEPTAGMGLNECRSLMELMAEHAGIEKITRLFVEHDSDLVFRFADRIALMSRGKIFAEGTPTEISTNSAVQDIYLDPGHRASRWSGQEFSRYAFAILHGVTKKGGSWADAQDSCPSTRCS